MYTNQNHHACTDIQFHKITVIIHCSGSLLLQCSTQGIRAQALGAAVPELQMVSPLFISCVRLPKLCTPSAKLE